MYNVYMIIIGSTTYRGLKGLFVYGRGDPCGRPGLALACP
jgi:hypothetical protein